VCRRKYVYGIRVAAVLFAAVVLASPAIATEQTAADRQDTSAVSKQDRTVAREDEAKVCKRVVPTGSRIARRYCLTRSEWDAMRDAGQKAARDAFALESQYGYDASPSGS